MTLSLTWKILRAALWAAITAFVASGIAGCLEDALGWSDDPRWSFYACGFALTGAGLVGSVVARIVAALRKGESRFPTALLIAAFVVGVLVLAVLVVTHLGPMGVV